MKILETMQYILAVRRSDITDVLTNATGTWHMISEEPYRILKSLQTNLLVQQARQIQCQNAVHKSKQLTGGSPGLPYLQ